MSDAESLSKEKANILAEHHGWSPAFAEGYVEGEFQRRRGNAVGAYATVAMTPYCLGFRAGYFARRGLSSTPRDLPVESPQAQQSVN